MIVFTEGHFGEAVGEILQRQVGARVYGLTASRQELGRLVSGADFVAVAMWRLYEKECEEVDEACTRAGVPWSSAHLMQEMLYCGPLVPPSGGPCFSCFRRRYLTHHRAPERELALLQAYAGDPALGTPGFVTPMAWVAASALIEDSREVDSAAGRLRRLDVCTGGMTDTRVLAVHNCARCGRRTADGRPGERFVQQLAPVVQDLLGGAPSDDAFAPFAAADGGGR